MKRKSIAALVALVLALSALLTFTGCPNGAGAEFVAPNMGTAADIRVSGTATKPTKDEAQAMFGSEFQNLVTEANSHSTPRGLDARSRQLALINKHEDYVINWSDSSNGTVAISGNVVLNVDVKQPSGSPVGQTIRDFAVMTGAGKLEGTLTDRVLAGGTTMTGKMLLKTDMGLKVDLIFTGATAGMEGNYHAYLSFGAALAIKQGNGKGAKYIVSASSIVGPKTFSTTNPQELLDMMRPTASALNVKVYDYSTNEFLYEFSWDLVPLQ